MGRRRTDPALAWLPTRVYKGRSAYEFRPRTGENIRLAPLTAKPTEVLKRHAEELARYEKKDGKVALIIEEFFGSESFRSLKPSSQKKYQQNSKLVLKVFGNMKAKSVKPEHIRRYMDERAATGKVAANRELSFMSRMFGWAYERGKVPINPCKGVRKFTETGRDRYVTDEEYAAVLNAAEPTLQGIMEISYCCAARISDVLILERPQILEEGIFIQQGKTGKKQIKQWSDRLKAAYDLLLATCGDRTHHVVLNSFGSRMSYQAFRKRWTEAIQKAQKQHPQLNLDFTFHDIKAKSISDFEGDKKQFSGHKSELMINVYNRKIDIVPTHE